MSTINGTDGNDSVTVTGGTTAADTRYYDVDLGAGVDSLTLDYRSMVQGVSLFGELVGSSGYQGYFVTGRGESYSPLLYANHFEHLTFLGGQGDDDVSVYEDLQGGLIATGAGNDLISYSGVGQAAIDGGMGYDSLYIWDWHLPADSAQWNLTINGIEYVSAYFQTEHDLVIDQAHFGADLEYLTLECSGTVSIDGHFAARNDLYANVFLGGADDTLILDYRGLNYVSAFSDGGGGTSDGDGISFNGEEHLTILSGEARDDFGFGDSSVQLTIVSAGGDDYIDAGSADDLISAGSGDDTVITGLGRDTVYGGSGNDGIYGSDLPGTLSNDVGDLIFGDAGDDWIHAATYDDTISGGMGNDTITDDGGNDTISGGMGNDTINDLGGRDSIGGGSGDDYIECSTDSAMVYGGSGNDTIHLVPQDKIIPGLFSDISITLGSQVRVYGGEGNDTITGCGSVFGGNGNDSITVISDFLPSVISAGSGDDAVTVLSASKDTIYGGLGNDVIDASAGVQDLIFGGIGNDKLLGSYFADTIFGGMDMDTLAGGAGADELMGGRGADWFVFDSAPSSSNIDKVLDFISGVDHLVLDDATFAALGVAGVETGAALPAELFHAGTAASTAEQRVIFTRASGALYYDADGSGSGEAVQIALIAGNTALLNAGDFLII